MRGRSSSSRRFRSEGQFVPFARRQADGGVSGLRRRRRIGRPGVRSGDRAVLRQRQRSRVDRRARAEHRRPERPGAVPAALRVLPSRRSRRHAAADPVARRHRRSRRRSRRSSASSARAAGGWPAFPALEATAVNAIVQFVTHRRGCAAARGAAAASSQRAAHPLINNAFRFTGYQKFLDPDGYPAVAPPWGTLNAIDLNTGEYAWKVPLGEYPELVAQGLKDTGSENYGGPSSRPAGWCSSPRRITIARSARSTSAPARCSGKRRCPRRATRRPRCTRWAAASSWRVSAGGGKSPNGGPGGVYVAYALPK